jgi:phosphoglycolate phosphatase
VRYTASGIMKIILFDIDGTLLRGHGAGSRAMVRAGRKVCGEAFGLDGIAMGGGLDPTIYAEATRNMGLLDAHTLHDDFREAYLLELQRELAEAERRSELLPGVTQLLESLHGRPELAIGLLTGNYRPAASIKFRAVGLLEHFFVEGAFGGDAETRPGLVPIALARIASTLGHPTTTHDVTIVGDTPRDIDCALQNGCRCLAVTTGYHPSEELWAAGAHCVVDTLEDPKALAFLLDEPTIMRERPP